MLTYIYKAKTPEGLIVSGATESEKRQSVVAALKGKGYYLLSVEPEDRFSRTLRRAGHLGSGVKTREKAIFTHQLATLLKSGMHLVTALKTLSKQCENKYLASAVGHIHTNVEGSSSLSQAMSKHPKIFSAVYTAIVKSAEETGMLAETLDILGKQLKSQSAVHSRIRSALAYPIFLLVVSIGIVGVLVSFVVPKFIELFVNANQKLPLPTQILVNITDFFQELWWVALFVLVALSLLVISAMRDAKTRLAVDRLVLKIPVVGAIIQKLQMARFSRTLGSLLNGGVNIISAIKTTKATISSQALAVQIDTIESEILKGSSIAKAIAGQGHFSEMLTNMIAVGEESGMLPEMLLEVADIYDLESESAIDTITTLLGPLMIVVLGTIIGFVVLAILLPIFETTTMVH